MLGKNIIIGIFVSHELFLNKSNYIGNWTGYLETGNIVSNHTSGSFLNYHLDEVFFSNFYFFNVDRNYLMRFATDPDKRARFAHKSISLIDCIQMQASRQANCPST